MDDRRSHNFQFEVRILKIVMIAKRTDITIVLPGMLEFKSSRGGGREERLYQIARRISEQHVISMIAPFFGKYNSRLVVGKKLILQEVFYPATKEYPQKSLLAKVMSILGSIFYSLWAIQIIIQDKKQGTRVVVVSDLFSGVLPSIVARILGVKVIWYEGNLFPWWIDSHQRISQVLMKTVNTVLARILSYLTSRIVVNDGMVKKALGNFVEKEVIIIRAGVDTSAFRPIYTLNETKKFRVGFIGRLSEEKGVIQLVDVCSYAMKTLPDVRFVIMGDGPQKHFLQNQKNISHVGMVDHSKICEMLSKVDIVMSFQSTFGLGEVESLACAKPILGKRIGEMPILIEKEKVGVLCNANTESFIESISYLKQNTEELGELSENARQLAIREYDWEIIASKWRDVIFDS
jgi:glycosyltransferase involved in cell wall biosynthesis